MSSAAGMPGTFLVRSCAVQRAAVHQRRPPERTAGLKACAAQMATATERGWFRRRQGAVRVVDCPCCAMEVVQVLLVGPINLFLN